MVIISNVAILVEGTVPAASKAKGAATLRHPGLLLGALMGVATPPGLLLGVHMAVAAKAEDQVGTTAAVVVEADHEGRCHHLQLGEATAQAMVAAVKRDRMIMAQTEAEMEAEMQAVGMAATHRTSRSERATTQHHRVQAEEAAATVDTAAREEEAPETRAREAEKAVARAKEVTVDDVLLSAVALTLSF